LFPGRRFRQGSFLHGDESITPKEIDAAVVAGVDAFLRAYST
jgi:hypothetical protein